MTLTPTWRNRLFALAAGALAIWIGNRVAYGEFALPVVVSSALVLLGLALCQPVPVSAWALGATLLGYVIGNRGFAQLSLTGRLPLLPAEACLLLVGSLQIVQAAWRRERPWRNDFLNLALGLWILVGCGRLLPDLRAYGFLAVRDFAVVYYALFFFLGQAVGRDETSRRCIQRTLLLACLLLLPIYSAYQQWPEFFAGTLTVRGNPLILFKDDLAGTFLAVGAVIFFLRSEESHRWAWLLASLAAMLVALATGNRASMLGLIGTAVLLAVRGRWRFGGLLAGAGCIAIIVTLLVAAATKTPFESTPVYRGIERVASIVDLQGQGSYSGDNAPKADNNLFRRTWWRNVVDETVELNPWFGLGFGYDLAARFLRDYQPGEADDFTARSPHSVVLTVFGRMGAIGLAAFLSVLAAILVETWRAFRNRSEATPLLAGAWTIFISACFGVVLEGPMGAVVFWTILGLAHSCHAEAADSSTAPSTDADRSDLAACFPTKAE